MLTFDGLTFNSFNISGSQFLPGQWKGWTLQCWFRGEITNQWEEIN